jgi:hypothetical protein
LEIDVGRIADERQWRLTTRRGQPAGQIGGSFFRDTPAGYKAEHTAEQQRQAESGRKVELMPLEKLRRQWYRATE